MMMSSSKTCSTYPRQPLTFFLLEETSMLIIFSLVVVTTTHQLNLPLFLCSRNRPLQRLNLPHSSMNSDIRNSNINLMSLRNALPIPENNLSPHRYLRSLKTQTGSLLVMEEEYSNITILTRETRHRWKILDQTPTNMKTGKTYFFHLRSGVAGSCENENVKRRTSSGNMSLGYLGYLSSSLHFLREAGTGKKKQVLLYFPCQREHLTNSYTIARQLPSRQDI